MYETVPEMPDMPYTPSKAGGDPSKDWMAIVSLVLGILNLCSICSFFLPPVCCLTILPTIGAIVFGILGMKSTKRTLAIVGLVLGGLGLLMQIIASLIGLIGGTFFSALESATGSMEFFDFLDTY
jgi:hypothetical protein